MTFLIIVIVLVLIIDFLNGFHVPRIQSNSISCWQTLPQVTVAISSCFQLGSWWKWCPEVDGYIIWVALIVTNQFAKDAPIDLWIVLSCHSVIALGILFGGWRIVKTMGQKITKLKPFEGFCAETAGALTLFGATHFGILVSTTHTITGSIIGAGALKGISAVKWGVTKKIFWAWYWKT